MLFNLPQEVLFEILSFLTPEDAAFLSLTCRAGYQHHRDYTNNLDLYYSINAQLKKFGYTIPPIHLYTKGIKEESKSAALLNFLNNFKELKNEITTLYFNEKWRKDVSLKRQISNTLDEYLTKLGGEKGLSIANLENLLINYESHIKNNQFLEIWVNPIYIRVYLEVYRMSLVFRLSQPTNNNNIDDYKRLILFNLLALKLQEFSSCFCLLDLMKKIIFQKNTALENYLTKYLKVVSYREKFYSIDIRETFYKLAKFAFFKNWNLRIDVTNVKHIMFLDKFDYLKALLFSNECRSQIFLLITQYGNILGLEYFNSIDKQTFSLSQKIISSKDFLSSLNTMNEFIQSQKKNNKEVDFYNLFAKNPELFDRLSLNEISKLKSHFLNFLRTNPGAFETNLDWKFDCIEKLTEECLHVLEKIPECIAFWSPYETFEFAHKSKSNYSRIFKILESCSHRPLLLKYLRFKDVVDLNNCVFEKSSLLEILANNNNGLFCGFILDKYQNANTIIAAIKSSSMTTMLFEVTELSLLLKKFPNYYGMMDTFENCKGGKQLELIQSLAIVNAEFFKYMMETVNTEQIEMLHQMGLLGIVAVNPLLSMLIIKNRLSYIELLNESQFLIELSKLVNEQSHAPILDIDFKTIKQFEKEKLLVQLLSIESRSLFQWILFGNNEKTSLRSFPDIGKLFSYQIHIILDKFCIRKHSGTITEITHFDTLLLEALDIWNMVGSPMGINLLKNICRYHPGFFVYALKNIEAIQGSTLQLLSIFYDKNFEEKLKNTSHGWMFLFYFKKDELDHLKTTHINKKSVLDYFLDKNYEDLFKSLIISSASDIRLNYGEWLIGELGLPSKYEICFPLFIELLEIFIQNKILDKSIFCNLLLTHFKQDQMIKLSKSIISFNGSTCSGLMFLKFALQKKILREVINGCTSLEDVEKKAAQWGTMYQYSDAKNVSFFPTVGVKRKSEEDEEDVDFRENKDPRIENI